MHKAEELYSHATDSPEHLPALSLAYIGDAVYELYVRTLMLEKSNNAHTLNKLGVRLVNNKMQSSLFECLEPLLDDVELGVLRRGRNAKGIVPKNAETQNYRRATAVEALFGYWYLTDNEERLKMAVDLLLSLEAKE